MERPQPTATHPPDQRFTSYREHRSQTVQILDAAGIRGRGLRATFTWFREATYLQEPPVVIYSHGEMAHFWGVKSTSTVKRRLDKLKAAGLVTDLDANGRNNIHRYLVATACPQNAGYGIGKDNRRTTSGLPPEVGHQPPSRAEGTAKCEDDRMHPATDLRFPRSANRFDGWCGWCRCPVSPGEGILYYPDRANRGFYFVLCTEHSSHLHRYLVDVNVNEVFTTCEDCHVLLDPFDGYTWRASKKQWIAYCAECLKWNGPTLEHMEMIQARHSEWWFGR